MEGVGPVAPSLPWPLLVTVAVMAAVLGATHGLFALRARRRATRVGFTRHVVMLSVTGVGIVAVIVALPASDALRVQLLGLLGLALTGMVAFSSTTFVANAMAGLMLRAVGNFHVGDFLRVGEHFGRVTERGLFHTEIQTEDRDLATLPNLFLVTNPVKVVRESGTLVSATLSLGYDLPHARVEALLLDAATTAALDEPFVHVLDLGDASVRYRVAGFLRDVTHLLTSRSSLHASILDTLHGADIEIVSPSFMNQRRLAEGHRFVPATGPADAPPAEVTSAEELMFDKADEKASVEELRLEHQRLLAEIDELEGSVDDAEQAEKPGIADEIARRRARCEQLSAALRAADAKVAAE